MPPRILKDSATFRPRSTCSPHFYAACTENTASGKRSLRSDTKSFWSRNSAPPRFLLAAFFFVTEAEVFK